LVLFSFDKKKPLDQISFNIMPTLATNKKARYDYQILQTYTAGLVLSGKMVKQLRLKRVNLDGRFAVFQGGNLQVIGIGNETVTENIQLMLSKKELDDIKEQIDQKGVTCILLNIHTQKRWIKAEIATVKGKKKWDKREDIKKRDIERELKREVA
jgi:SsrA-binding protein